MGEIEIIDNGHCIERKVKCRKCGFTNETENKGPEVLIIKKRPVQ